MRNSEECFECGASTVMIYEFIFGGFIFLCRTCYTEEYADDSVDSKNRGEASIN